MAATTYMRKAMLDWALLGAVPTRPAGCFLMFATGSPDADGASDGPFSPRRTVTFAAANSAQGSVTNVAIITGITATAAATPIGWNIYDAVAGGNRLFYGTLAAGVGGNSGDVFRMNAGSMKVLLS